MTEKKECKPAVSVIVLTYNQVGTFVRALESVADIAGDECEVVVSDDGSTDGTRELLERYADEHPDRIRLLPRHGNMGLTANYFYALSQCRGRYITDLAGDDRRVDSEAILRFADMLDSLPDAVAVSSRWIAEGTIFGCQSPTADSREMMIRLLSFAKPQPMMLSALLYRKSVIDDALVREKPVVCNESFGCEDLPVMMALLDAGTVICSPEVTVEYTPSADSVTTTRDAGRRAVYAAGLCRASIALSRRYGLDDEPGVKRGLKDMCGYMLACAAASGVAKVADEAVSVSSAYGVELSAKARLYKTMLRSRRGQRSIAWLKSLIGFRLR